MGKLVRRKIAGLALVFSCIAASTALSAEMPNLSGTTWNGSDSDGTHYTLTFKQDGSLVYKSDRETIENGSWKQYNNALYYQANKRFMEALGEFADGKIEGTAWNIKQSSWFWKLSKAN
ncbi:MAG: hypothetical protein HGB36_09405 [Chlorobiaceae bacterium]|nr:hypothetical protein [Chlorobiaceae bacterium]